MLSKISPIEENKRKSACDGLQNPLFKLKQKDFIIKVIFACVSLLKLVYNTSEYRLPKSDIRGIQGVLCKRKNLGLMMSFVRPLQLLHLQCVNCARNKLLVTSYHMTSHFFRRSFSSSSYLCEVSLISHTDRHQ